MSVVFTRDQIESILSLYHLDAPEAFGAAAWDGAGARAHWVQVQGKRYLLRLSQRRSMEDMLFEKELLLQAARAGLSVPKLMQNVAKGSFTPWARRGRFVSLFVHPHGRVLGRFEIRPDHAREVGAWLGRFHRELRRFPRFKRPDAKSPGELLDRLERGLVTRRLARRFAPWVETLRAWEARLTWPTQLPTGATHQAFGLMAAVFRQGRLAGAVGFERAAIDHLLVDVAHALSEWAWHPSPEPGGGPAGSFEPERVSAFLAGYQRARRLTPSERKALPDAMAWVAVREAARRLVRHGLRSRRVQQPYEDPRHQLARLDALSQPNPLG